MATKTIPLVRRSETPDCSATNTCLQSNNSLVIILASCLPILLACVVLFFIHRHHLKRVRREEKNDKDFDMDSGVGEFPVVAAPLALAAASREKHDPYLAGSAASIKNMNLGTAPTTAPYLVPKANMSRESLHSLSDPRDNPYGAIYTSAPPSPTVGVLSPFSDQASIGGRSNKSLLPTLAVHDDNFGLASRPPSRVASPLATPDVLQEPKAPSPAKPSSRSPLRDQSQPEENTQSENVPQFQPNSPPRAKSGPTEHPGPVTHADYSPPVPADPFVSSAYDNFHEGADNYHVVAANHGKEREIPQRQNDESELMSEIPKLPSNHPLEHNHDLRSSEADLYQQTSEIDTGPPHIEGEAEEDRAKRIQSIYQEYWRDANYYDGSEEWASLPHEPHHPIQAQQSPADNRHGWRDDSQDYYEAHQWQQDNRGPSRNRYDDRQRPREAVGLDFNDSRWETPPSRPYHSRPSTSYSTSSLPSRTRTPSKPLEPLQPLPSRGKLDDLASPISYSKPRRFIGAAGRADPTNRPASPVQVLSSSRSNLAELPTPHRLRRSGSFSSIEFAPMRKYATSEVDAGDTGSIRSLARTEASLMAVSAGAGRVNRLPQDLVPMGKSGMAAALRPQNYGDVRFG